jgi:hypothetical protein
MDCGSSRMSKKWFKSVTGVKIHYKLNLGFLDVQANLPEDSHLLSAKMAGLNSFLIFLVLGMYKFDCK